MESKLKNKVAVITGSSMGIGKSTAIELARCGVNVVVNGRDSSKLREVANELESMGATYLSIKADVRFEEECERLINEAISEFGRIDILINNAAIGARGAMEESVPSNFHTVIATNLLGPMYLTRYAVPILRRTNGHIIFINSIAGFVSLPFNAAYSCSKAALTVLTDALEPELADTGIHIGNIWVGFTENDPRKKLLDKDGTWIYLPNRNNVRKLTRERVAKKIRIMIEKRKRVMVLSFLGKLGFLLHRISPAFVRFFVLINRHNIRKNYTYFGGHPVYEESRNKEQDKSKTHSVA